VHVKLVLQIKTY